MWRPIYDINDKQLFTLAQLRAFLNGTAALDFAVATEECYEFIARTLRYFGYCRVKRSEKAVVLRFLERVASPYGLLKTLPPFRLIEFRAIRSTRESVTSAILKLLIVRVSGSSVSPKLATIE